MFNTAYGDNSWVFTGGSAVQGGYAQTQGIRNYIGQFEEYVRWTRIMVLLLSLFTAKGF